MASDARDIFDKFRLKNPEESFRIHESKLRLPKELLARDLIRQVEVPTTPFMGKALVIAEKPSVAADIAKALGGFKRVDDYFERDDTIVASAVGHLLEIRAPEAFEAKKGKWSFNALPVIPPHFDLQPREKSEAKLKTLQKLIKRKDVDALVNACDAGREGELIFRYITQYAQARQPIRRLWLQSMTPAAIREGFNRLRSDQEMQPLAAAATCRSESDWLVGINGTRVMTAFNSKGGGFNKTTVGRVQTPTLAILVEREEKIRKFVPRNYWELHATFGCEAGQYVGRWFDERFTKPAGKDADEALRADRILGCRQGDRNPGTLPGQTGHCDRGEQAQQPALAHAVRPHNPPT